VEIGFRKSFDQRVGSRQFRRRKSCPVLVTATPSILFPQRHQADGVNPMKSLSCGIDNVAVGQFAAAFKAVRKPEPYHGYGSVIR
jgi:hypothetical protein